jgi:hypothetical protein
MSIYSEIERIVREVDTQETNLASVESQLAEALTLLDGKALGSGVVSGILIDKGEFTVSSDISSDYSVPHKLGRTPNFYIIFTDDEIADASVYKGYMHNSYYTRDKYYHSGTVRIGYVFTTYGSSSGTIFAASSAYQANEICTDTTFYVKATTTAKLKAGLKYNYICGYIEGM